MQSLHPYSHDGDRKRYAVLSDACGPTMRGVETDLELLSRLRNGDEEAYVMLVGRYQQPMLRLARTMVPSHAVEIPAAD